MPLFRAYLAISADGFIARADGSFDWLLDYDPVQFGYSDFMAGIGSLVMGRNSYEVARGLGGEWLYGEKNTYVVTSGHLADLPLRTETRSADFAALAAELREKQDGDIWLYGGPQLWAGFLDAGALDRLELYVIPVLLGSGMPLLPPRRQDVQLSLLDATPLTRGVVRLVYRPELSA